MSVKHKKPQSLKPLPSTYKYVFLIGVFLAGSLILIGWFVTIRDVLNAQTPQIQSVIQEQWNTVNTEIEQAQSQIEDTTSSFEESFEQVQEGYEAQQQLNNKDVAN